MAAEEIFKYYAKGTDACGKGVPTVPLPIRLWGLRCTLRQPNKVRPKKMDFVHIWGQKEALTILLLLHLLVTTEKTGET